MPTLEELINAIPDAAQTEEAYLTRAKADIQQQAKDNAQKLMEQMFARGVGQGGSGGPGVATGGLGLSTALADLLTRNAGVEADALTKARGEAFNAAQQARNSALANAANFQLRREALGQQARQAKQNAGQAKANMWMQAGTGLGGGLLKTAGDLFGPKLKDMVNDYIGKRPAGAGYGPASNELQTVGPAPIEEPGITQPEIAPVGIAAPNLGDFVSNSPSIGDVTQDFDWSSLQMPQLFSTGPSLQDLLDFNFA